MKKLVISAITATLFFAGWHASAVFAAPATAPEIHYGAKKKPAADADTEDTDADDADEDDSKGKGKHKKGKKAKKADKKAANSGEAGKALKGIKFFGGRPNLKAKYFIYLQASADNLHSSNMIDDIMTEYKKMKKDGRVEIIYVGHDDSASVAKKFLHQHRAKFPGVLKDDQDAQSLPGFAPSTTIPNVIIIDADGNVVKKGDGAVITTGEWKTYTIDKDDEESNDGGEE